MGSSWQDEVVAWGVGRVGKAPRRGWRKGAFGFESQMNRRFIAVRGRIRNENWVSYTFIDQSTCLHAAWLLVSTLAWQSAYRTCLVESPSISVTLCIFLCAQTRFFCFDILLSVYHTNDHVTLCIYLYARIESTHRQTETGRHRQTNKETDTEYGKQWRFIQLEIIIGRHWLMK